MLTLPRSVAQQITGHFSEEFQERLLNRILVQQIEEAIAAGKMPPIGGAAAGFYVTNAEAISMLTDYAVGINAGTAAQIEIFSGAVPADADAANAGTQLAELTCSASVFSGIADATGKARATFDTITSDSSANNSGTATFGRILTQDLGTVVAQFTVGTASADLILNTVSITAGSTVSITAATIDLPEGP